MSTTDMNDIMAISMKIAEDYIRDTESEFADIKRQMAAADRITREAIDNGDADKAIHYMMKQVELLQKYSDKAKEVQEPNRLFNYTMSKLLR